MLASVLFNFGVTVLVALGVLLWYRVYGTLLFHAGIVFVLPAYLVEVAKDGLGGTWLWVPAALALICFVAFAAYVLNSIFFAEGPLVARGYLPWRRIDTKTGILLGSLGLNTAGVAAVRWAFASSPRRVELGIPSLEESAVGLGLVSAGAGLLLYLAVAYLLQRSDAGLVLRAVTTNAEAAGAFGLRGVVPTAVAVCAGGALLGLAGVILATDSGVTPAGGFRWLLAGASAMILSSANLEGGLFPGIGLGSACVALLVAAGTWIFGSIWADALLFFILVGVLLVKPEGLLAQASRR